MNVDVKNMNKWWNKIRDKTSAFFNPKEKEPWQIAAARFCVENSETGFRDQDLIARINEDYAVDERHITHFLHEEIRRPSGRSWSRNDVEGSWVPPMDLVSKLIDYDELKEARKNANQAFWLSTIAIIVSGVTLAVTIFK